MNSSMNVKAVIFHVGQTEWYSNAALELVAGLPLEDSRHELASRARDLTNECQNDMVFGRCTDDQAVHAHGQNRDIYEVIKASFEQPPAVPTPEEIALHEKAARMAEMTSRAVDILTNLRFDQVFGSALKDDHLYYRSLLDCLGRHYQSATDYELSEAADRARVVLGGGPYSGSLTIS